MCLECGHDFCECACDYPENVLSQAIKDALSEELTEIDGSIADAKKSAEDSAASATESKGYADDAAASAAAAKVSETQAELSAATAVEAASTATHVTGDLPAILDRLEQTTEDLEQTTENLNQAIAAFELDSYAALKAMKPSHLGQIVRLRSYVSGKNIGGGEFISITKASGAVDDGGVLCIPTDTSSQWHWKRMGDPSTFDVTNFGAVPDDATDCAAACLRMYQWSQKAVYPGNCIGIQFPAGKFALGAMTDQSGAYVSQFRMAGPDVEFGYLAQTRLRLIGADESIAIHVQARQVDISGLNIYGQMDVDSVKRHFFRNEVTRGAYFHGKCIRMSYVGGKCFFMYDTLDTKFNEFYASNCYDNVIGAWMSGQSPGSWFHITAIELCNFNIQSHKADAAGKDAIFLPRAGQSLIRNGWIEKSAYPANISEGSWHILWLSLEGNTNPVYAQYSKLLTNWINFNGTGGIDRENGAVGNLNGVTRPSWVTSAYEQGSIIMNGQHANFDNITTLKTQGSMFRFGQNTAKDLWYNLGTFNIGGSVGTSAKIRILGPGGFTSATSDPSPNSVNYAVGEAVIGLQNKDQVTKTTVTWYAVGSSPIVDVKYIQNYPGTVEIYVMVRKYTNNIAAFVETTGPNRTQSGSPFYWRDALALVDDITTVADLKDASSAVTFNNGTYGFGMDFKTGVLAFSVPNGGVNATSALKTKLNGTDFTIPLSTPGYPVRMHRINKADLPNSDVGVYLQYLVLDTSKGAMPCFNAGYGWKFFDGSSMT